MSLSTVTAREGHTTVVSHFDVHGVCAGVLAAKRFGASEIICNYPATSPEQLIQTLQNLIAAAPQRLRVVIVDVPVNLKDPAGFVEGLERLAELHDILFIDHHETSLQWIQRFAKVKTVFVGTSALLMNRALLPQRPERIDEELAIIGAIGDRDPEVVEQGLLTNERREITDGLDVLVRRPNGAQQVTNRLLREPEIVLEEARHEADKIPEAELERTIGVVAVAKRAVENWGPKSLEKLAFRTGTWYAVGPEYVPRQQMWVVRAIARWDIIAKRNIPLPGEVARRLWATRSIIGHPAAPSVAATSEEEAKEMAVKLAEELNNAVSTSLRRPGVSHLVNIESVGELVAEVLMKLEQILEQQNKMYQEYLQLKREQVELLRRTQRHEYD